MPTYETLFITSPNLSEDEESATVSAMAQIVTDGGGTFTTRDRMGRRRLAYTITKFTDGVYTRFLYDSTAEVPKELERRLRLTDRVLRSLTVRLQEDWAVEAKLQAVRDAQAREEALLREQQEAQLEAERAAAAPAEAEAPAADAGAGPGAQLPAEPPDEPADEEEA